MTEDATNGADTSDVWSSDTAACVWVKQANGNAAVMKHRKHVP